MAQTSPSSSLPRVTEEAFVADRARFWKAFNGFTVAGIVVVIGVVLLTLYFIL